jgi:hypothetical protein
LYRWVDGRGGSRINYKDYYREWLFGRRTLTEIADKLGISYPKLTQEFDKIVIAEGVQIAPPAKPINLLVDATFFGREYGFLCFHDTNRIIYFHEIKTETMADLRAGLFALHKAGWRFASVTIDGKRGYYQNIRKLLGNVPIQMCIFHQKAIMRRYITDKPKSACGKDLKALMGALCHMDHQEFIDKFYMLLREYKGFLDERNDKGGYMHSKLRAAFRSMQENLPLIFMYTDFPSLNIPPTTNHLEGAFSHLKEKIRIHRGLSSERKKNAIRFILSSPPFF